MKSILVIACLFFIFTTSAQTPGASDLKKLKWLEGSWTRTNVKPGRSGSEHWQKISDSEWHGRGISMKGTDTTYVEKLKILVRDGSIYYVADVPENQKPVFFKFTELTDNSFVCENPEHDFPKKISYLKESANKVKAVISGDGKSVDYLFERK